MKQYDFPRQNFLYILDENEEPIATHDVVAWSEWFGRAARHVDYTLLFDGEVAVSTVFLGSDHNYGRGRRPILWESLVFGGELDGEMWRYTSYQEAVQGHRALVGLCRLAGLGHPPETGDE